MSRSIIRVRSSVGPSVRRSLVHLMETYSLELSSDRHKERQTDKHVDIHTDRQAHGHTHIETDTQTQTHRHTHTDTHTHKLT